MWCKSIGLVWWLAPLLIFAKRWQIFVFFQSVDFVTERSNAITDNGLQLGEVAEIKAQMFSFAQKFNRRTSV